MMSAALINPLPDDVFFSVTQLSAASTKAHEAPGDLSDYELSMLACYDRDGAQVAARRREVARVKALHPAPARPAPSVAQKTADGLTVREGNLLKAIGGVLRPLFEQYESRLTVLETENSALRARLTGVETKADAPPSSDGADGVRYALVLERLMALEQRPSLEDRGVWDGTESYKTMAGVTHDGGYWLATRASCGEKPGGSSAWRLAVRRGKPGKDGQDFR